MDKQEYKLKAEEIKSLIKKRDFFEAVKIADEIDWRRVRSVRMLCTVSDLYKVNRRYKESKELLLMAYERNPNGRTIIYSLCELCIKMGEVVQAIEYYKAYVQLAPMDNGKYILQYKLYVAQDVSLEERIAVLEELKKREYLEKWGYELAYLYHRIGLATRCVEECDELILWFSDGRYVKKAMELKMLHQPLTPAQEASYNSFVGKNAELPKVVPVEEKPIEEQIQVQPMNLGQYDTINLQKELAESIKGVVSEPVKEEPVGLERLEDVPGPGMNSMFQNSEDMKEIFFEDKTGEMLSAPLQIKESSPSDTMSEKAEEPAVAVMSQVQEVKEEEPAVAVMSQVQEVKEEEPAVAVMSQVQEVKEEEPVVAELSRVQEVKEEEPAVAVMSQVQEVKEEEPVVPVVSQIQEAEEPAVAEISQVQEVKEEEPVVAELSRVQEVKEEEPAVAVMSQVQEVREEEPAVPVVSQIQEAEGKEPIAEDLAASVISQIQEVKEEEVAAPVISQVQEVKEEEPAAEETTGFEMTQAREEEIPITEEAVVSGGTEIASEAGANPEETSEVAEKELIVEEERKEPVQGRTTKAKKIEISTRGIAHEVPSDATKKLPSIREIMQRPLIDTPVETENVVMKEGYTADGIPENMADLLSQEYDGQISLVVQENAKIEKQITGQMNIEEVMLEWEKAKKENAEKRTEDFRKQVLEQTGSMFTEFEAQIRDGILEQLEKEAQLEEENSGRSGNVDSLTGRILVPEIEETVGFDVEAIILAEMAEEDAKERAEAETGAEEYEEEIKEVVKYEKGSPVSEETDIEEDDAAESTSQEFDTEESNIEETVRKVKQAQPREFSEEEKTLFAPFLHTKGARRRFMEALDQISLASYTGNVIVTGEADSDTLKLAKNIMKNIQMTDGNFTGVIAKVSGVSLNSKGIESTIAKLNNGGLIIEKASGMNSQAVTKLLKALDQEQTGIVVILEDDKKAMKRMLAAYPAMDSFFNARFEIETLSNGMLASYGRQYAAHMEYAIDELGMLALQTEIESRQTSDHVVTVAEVRELVDDAIYSANRKTLGHFFDVIFGRRYDEQDMIILRERDFM